MLTQKKTYIQNKASTKIDQRDKKIIYFPAQQWFRLTLHLHHAYSSTVKFTRLIPWNFWAQHEKMVKPIYSLVLIQHHVVRILSKNTFVKPSYQPLLLGENYTQVKAWQLRFVQKTLSEMFWRKTSFEAKHLSHHFYNKSWY